MSKSLFVVREAVDVLQRRLTCLSPSEKADELQVSLRDCLKEAEQWCASAPTHQEHDGLSKRVLALHVAVTKLERNARLADRLLDGLAAPWPC
jgi:hypothetical protein